MTIFKIANVFYILLTVMFFDQCTARYDDKQTRLERALDLAGDNEEELRKVLSRYSRESNDSLKFKAAVFLIENMPGHIYYKGEQLDNYMEYYSLLPEAIASGRGALAAVDTIRNRYGEFDLSKIEQISDIETVDSAYLCDNIEQAFKAWKEQPWGKNVSFETFCEYILPYRIGNETLVKWREDYYNEYNCILDSLRQSNGPEKEDPFQAAKTVLSYIDKTFKNSFTMNIPVVLPNVGPNVVKNHSGTCREFTDFVIYVCRSLAIPCAVDYMPVRGNENSGHSWIVFWDKDGTPFYRDNEGPALLIHGSNLYNTPKAKVYRHKYSSNYVAEIAAESAYKKMADVMARYVKTDDVTSLYSNHLVDTLTIDDSLIYKGRKPTIVFLCLNYDMGWSPVDWTTPERNKMEFRNINGGNIMRVLSYEEGKDRYWTDPFYIGYDGRIHIFKYDGNNIELTAYSKYPPAFFNSRMPGGVFEGSNDPLFRTKDTLYMITRKPLRLYNNVIVADTSRYRYIRYYGPSNGYCNVSEITFYGEDGNRLEGYPIGSLGADSNHGYNNAFDGSTLTSVDYVEPSGCWVGMDFGRPVRLERIMYSPRNYDNYVREGNKYELFYCDGIWKSAGTVTSMSDTVVYSDVPSGVLYFLKNHTGGVQERAFAYKDGRQYWDRECELLFPAIEKPEENLTQSIARISYERIWKGKYTYENPGVGWESPEFDDSEWEIGDAAYGTEGYATVHTPFLTKDIWIRRYIEFNPSDIIKKKLVVRYSYDDFLQLYINGRRVMEVKGWQTNEEQEIPDSIAMTMVNGKAVIAARGRNLDGEGIIDFGIYVRD